MNRTLISSVAAAALSLAATPAFAKCDKGEVVIKFSHVVAATGNPKGEAAQKLADRINKEMNGKACMEVYPNSQLYDDDKVLEAMLLGDVQLAAPSLSKFEKYTKTYRVFDLPFLFASMEQVRKFTGGPAGQKLLHAMDKVGFTGLDYWNNGLKQISAKKPLLTPSDAKGLKFRVQPSDVAVAMIRAMGASAQKMAFKEVYGALQTGVVDGQENSWSNIYSMKFFEVQDGVTETNHQLLNYLVVTSKPWLDGLKPDVRTQFLKILKEETEAGNASAEKINQEARAKIIAAGKKVRTLTAAQRAEWVKVMKPVWKKFEKDIGADVIEAAVAAGM
ncbi:MAG: DctP family TRAP transporter solute-binding subunit [Alphaproteobacteria bacterium]|jgi:C4-dicarboxylate-binding protein DctP|nr:DctP family TRAP transporter solute-binding subunit [Alphaproteobacteria bacterium]